MVAYMDIVVSSSLCVIMTLICCTNAKQPSPSTSNSGENKPGAPPLPPPPDLNKPFDRMRYFQERMKNRPPPPPQIPDSNDEKISDDMDPATRWRVFKTKNRKQFGNNSQEARCQKVFNENYAKIKEHRQLFRMHKVPYDLDVNQWADKTIDEVRDLNRLVVPANGTVVGRRRRRQDQAEEEPKAVEAQQPVAETRDNREAPLVINILNAVTAPPPLAIPASVDWRESGYVSPVKNQGNCGCCWAFAAAGAMEGQIFKKTGGTTPLSVQQLLDCDGAYGNIGCAGGWMMNAFNYISAKGIQSDASYPFTGAKGTCKYDDKSVVSKANGATYLSQLSNEQALMAAVATIGPIASAVDASTFDFIYYKTGVFNDPKCSQKINHGVLVVGYGTDKETGQDYWLIKNSWSTSWGEQGYMRLARNKNNLCGIATWPNYPLL